MNENHDRRLWKIVCVLLICLLILCVWWMRYDIVNVENAKDESAVIENVETKAGEVTIEKNYEIEVVGEVCNIYEIVGDCSIEEIVSAEVYVNGGTAKGQSYVVEKKVAPNLLQALIDVVFKEEAVYQEVEATYEDDSYDFFVEYTFSTGEVLTIYVVAPDMILYDGVVYKSYEEIDREAVNYGIREGFSRGNAVKDIE